MIPPMIGIFDIIQRNSTDPGLLEGNVDERREFILQRLEQERSVDIPLADLVDSEQVYYERGQNIYGHEATASQGYLDEPAVFKRIGEDMWKFASQRRTRPLLPVRYQHHNIKGFIGDDCNVEDNVILPMVFFLASSPLAMDTFVSKRVPSSYKMDLSTAIQLSCLLAADRETIPPKNWLNDERFTNVEKITELLLDHGYNTQYESLMLYTCITGRKWHELSYDPYKWDGGNLLHVHPLGVVTAAHVICGAFSFSKQRYQTIQRIENIDLYGLVSLFVELGEQHGTGIENFNLIIQICLKIRKLEDIQEIMFRFGIVPELVPGTNCYVWFFKNFHMYGPVVGRNSTAMSQIPTVPELFELFQPGESGAANRDNTLSRLAKEKAVDLLSKYTDVELISAYGTLYNVTYHRIRRVTNMCDELERNEKPGWTFKFRECSNIEASYPRMRGTIYSLLSRLLEGEDIILSYGTSYKYECFTSWFLFNSCTDYGLKINKEEINREDDVEVENLAEIDLPINKLKELRILLQAIPNDKKPLSYRRIIEILESIGTRYSRHIAARKKREAEELTKEMRNRFNAEESPVTLLIGRLNTIIENSERLANFVSKFKRLNQEWQEVPGWKNAMKNFFSWFMILTLWFRKWKGPGNPFPERWVNETADNNAQKILRRIGYDSSRVNELGDEDKKTIETYLANRVCSDANRDVNVVRESSVFVALALPEWLIYGDESKKPNDGLTSSFENTERDELRKYVSLILGIPGLDFNDPENKRHILEFAALLREIYVVDIKLGERFNFKGSLMITQSPERRMVKYLRRATSISRGNGVDQHCLAEASRLVGHTSLYFYYSVPEWHNRLDETTDDRYIATSGNLFNEMGDELNAQINRIYNSPSVTLQYQIRMLQGVTGAAPNERLNLDKLYGVGNYSGHTGGYGFATDLLHGRVENTPATEQVELSSHDALQLYMNTISPAALYWIRPPN